MEKKNGNTSLLKTNKQEKKRHFQTTRMKLCFLCLRSYVRVMSGCREMLFLYWSKIRIINKTLRNEEILTTKQNGL